MTTEKSVTVTERNISALRRFAAGKRISGGETRRLLEYGYITTDQYGGHIMTTKATQALQ